jgi:hypothetical protein
MIPVNSILEVKETYGSLPIRDLNGYLVQPVFVPAEVL